jgi:hypothetical protein
MLTNREYFYNISLIGDLFQTTSSQYYITPPISTDKRCQIGPQFNFLYEFNSFNAIATEVVNYIYVYKIYDDILCPMTTYNATFKVLNELGEIELTDAIFETSDYLIIRA